MARVLVTGGAGYLGSVLVPELLDRGHQVRLFDRFYFGQEPVRHFEQHSNVEIVKGDIRWVDDEFPDLLDDVDVVVHLCGLTNDPSCDLEPVLSREINVRATERLAERARAEGAKRFIFTSSCAVYGHGGAIPLTEQAPTQPVSVYADTQLDAERVLRRMAAEHGFDIVVLRLASLYGASPRMRFDIAINQMVASACTRGTIPVYGGGDQWRPFLHVRDAVRVIELCIDAPAGTLRGEIVNVGSNDANFPVAALAEYVASRFDGVSVEPAPSELDRRSYRIDCTKLATVLDFEPVYTMDDGIDEVRELVESGTIADPTDPIYHNALTLKRLRELPAALGGEPVLPTFIPFSRPCLGKEEEDEVIDSLRSGWITTGPKVERFERAFVERIGTAHAVAVSSCTAALHLSLVALDIGPGDEVITTPMTWPSCAHVILQQGATPVFVDIDPMTLNIDPARIEERITDRTRAILTVDMAGQPCDYGAIREIADRHGLPVIEDAAHAMGAAYRRRPIGTINEFTCFSFYANKVMTTVEGGMITLGDPDLASRLKVLRLFGMSKDAWQRYSPIGRHRSAEATMLGYKYNMTDVSAAIGLHQLRKLDSFLATRERLARMYDEAFADVEEIFLMKTIPDVERVYYAYIIALDIDRLGMSRFEFLDLLKEENVGTGVHFVAVHLHKYYRERFGLEPEDLPHATWASERILSLPLFPTLTETQLGEIVTAVKKTIAYALRR